MKSPTSSSGEKAYYQEDWHDYFEAVIPLVPVGSRVLDIGCGRGGLLRHLRDEKGCRVWGVDIGEEAVQICREKGIEATKCDVERDDITGTYDVVILCAVVEHLTDPVGLLYRLRRNLGIGGGLIAAVPNFSHLIARLLYLMGRNIKVFGEEVDDWTLGLQPYDHIQFFNEPSLTHVLHKTGYEVVKRKYFSSRPVPGSRNATPWTILSWPLRVCYGRVNLAAFSHLLVVKATKVDSVQETAGQVDIG